jgi:uncharacterized membrane protein
MGVPTCPSCGRLVPDSARFCPDCGWIIPGTAPVPAPTDAAPATDDAAAEVQQAVGTTVSGVPENVAGVLAYFIVPAIAFLLLQPFKRNRFIRFHSIQCLLTVGMLILLQIALVLLGKPMPLLVLSLYGLLILAGLTLWLLLLYKAYQHEMFKLPVLGDIARNWAAKS